MANPIWKDYYVSLGTAESVQFRILVGDDIVYTGKAFRRPGMSNNEIRINDICADYLENVFPNLVQTTVTEGKHVTFIVQAMSEGRWQTKSSVIFDNNWSYEYNYNPATMGVSSPINSKIDINQWVVFTAYEKSSLTAKVTLANGEFFDVIIPMGIGGDFNDDYNSDFSKSLRAVQSGTAVFRLSQWGDVKLLEVDGREFHVINGCNRYVLYYVNAYGGWDSFLIEGNHSISDNLIRYVREAEYDNRSVQNRGVHNYVNEISKTMTMHTSWLSDDESSRMHHLLNSTNVFLGDLATGQIIPVILTNTKTDYKTYKGNGGRLVNYAINVTIAQERIRR